MMNNIIKKLLNTKYKFKKQAFTLVELIVTITILAILGTIAFLSLQGYSRDARNSVRISDIKIIEKSMDIYLTKNNKLPYPDDYIIIESGSGNTIGYQGNIRKELKYNRYFNSFYIF